jgi:hypothetical protein
MSRKELPRAGLVTAAVAGRISNHEGGAALHLPPPRQFQLPAAEATLSAGAFLSRSAPESRRGRQHAPL